MRQPKKKPQKQNEELQRPEHHLFTNFRLNEMFCESPEEAVAWAENAIKVFEDNVTDLPEEVKADFVSYVVAVTEVSFEWGFKTAIDEVVTLAEESHKPLKVRASERDVSLLTNRSALTRYESVSCDEENFSSPEELRLVAHLAEAQQRSC